eukprot:gene2480-3189_t
MISFALDRQKSTGITLEKEGYLCKLHYEKALKFQSEKNYEASFAYYSKILKSPFVVEVFKTEKDDVKTNLFLYLKYLSLKNVGIMLMEQNKNKESVDYLLEAVKIDDRDATIWFNLGKLCFNTKKHFLCRTSLEKCISLNEYHLPAWNYLMGLLYKIGDFDDCKTVIERILKLNPKSEEALKYKNLLSKNKMCLEIPEEIMDEEMSEGEEENETEDVIHLDNLKSFLIQLLDLYNSRNEKFDDLEKKIIFKEKSTELKMSNEEIKEKNDEKKAIEEDDEEDDEDDEDEEEEGGEKKDEKEDEEKKKAKDEKRKRKEEKERKKEEKKKEKQQSYLENILSFFPDLEDVNYKFNSSKNDSELLITGEITSNQFSIFSNLIIRNENRGIFDIIICLFNNFMNTQIENSLKKYFIQLANCLIFHQISVTNEMLIFMCELLYNYGNPDDKAYCRRLLHSFSLDVLCNRDIKFHHLPLDLRIRSLWILGNLDEDQNRAKFCFEECIKQLKSEIKVYHCNLIISNTMIEKKIQKLDYKEFVQIGSEMFEIKKYKELLIHFSDELRNIQTYAEFLCSEIKNILIKTFYDSKFKLKGKHVIECLIFCLNDMDINDKHSIPLLKYLFLNLKSVRMSDEIDKKFILKEMVKILETKQNNQQLIELSLLIAYEIKLINKQEDNYHLLTAIFDSALQNYQIKSRFLYEEIIKSYYSLYLRELKHPTDLNLEGEKEKKKKTLKDRILKKLFKMFYILYGIKLTTKKELFKRSEELRLEPPKILNRKEICFIAFDILVPTCEISLTKETKSTYTQDQLSQILKKIYENFNETEIVNKQNIEETRKLIDSNELRGLSEFDESIENDVMMNENVDLDELSNLKNCLQDTKFSSLYKNLYYFLGIFISKSIDIENNENSIPIFLTKESYFESIKMLEISCSIDYKNFEKWKNLGLLYKEIFDRMLSILDFPSTTKDLILKNGRDNLRLGEKNFEKDLKIIGIRSLKCLEISQKLKKEKDVLNLVGNISFQFLKQKNSTTEEIEKFKLISEISFLNSNKLEQNQFQNFLFLGKLKEKYGHYKDALKYYLKSCELADIKTNNEPFFNLYKLLFTLYSQKNNSIPIEEYFFNFNINPFDLKKKSKTYHDYLPTEDEIKKLNLKGNISKIFEGFYICLLEDELDYKSVLSLSKIFEILGNVTISKHLLNGIFKVKSSKTPKKPDSFEFKIWFTENHLEEKDFECRNWLIECVKYYCSLLLKSNDLKSFSILITGLRLQVRKTLYWFLIDVFQFSLQQFLKLLESNGFPELNLFQLFIYASDNLIDNNEQFKNTLTFLIQSKCVLKESVNFKNLKEVEKYVVKHHEIDFHLPKSKSTDELKSELLN